MIRTLNLLVTKLLFSGTLIINFNFIKHITIIFKIFYTILNHPVALLLT